jgi:uncharacterized membrane protein YkvA (DUF1232 family)
VRSFLASFTFLGVTNTMSKQQPNPSAQADSYASDYTDDGFWAKIKGHAKEAGLAVVGKALELFYTMIEAETPVWAKATIAAALGYFISPIDVIPDILPGGYLDDLGVLAATLTAVASYVTEQVKTVAGDKLAEWFD